MPFCDPACTFPHRGRSRCHCDNSPPRNPRCNLDPVTVTGSLAICEAEETDFAFTPVLMAAPISISVVDPGVAIPPRTQDADEAISPAPPIS